MNSQLQGNEYNIPENILKYINSKIIQYPTNNGIKRAKFLINNGKISYESLKRIKNFFDMFNNVEDDKIQYELAGGLLMKNWIENTLKVERNKVEKSKEIRQDSNPNINNALKAQNANTIDVSKNKL